MTAAEINQQITLWVRYQPKLQDLLDTARDCGWTDADILAWWQDMFPEDRPAYCIN